MIDESVLGTEERLARVRPRKIRWAVRVSPAEVWAE
jgi:hypothetical protein